MSLPTHRASDRSFVTAPGPVRGLCGAALMLAGTAPAHAQCTAPGYGITPHQSYCAPNGTVNESLFFDLDGPGPEPTSLVVCGAFTLAGDERANNVAAFNGTEWRTLSTGLNNWVFCLAVYNNELYAGGTFTARGPGGLATPINRVARWDGAEWQPLGAGIDATDTLFPQVYALQAFNGRLYAGGNFNRAGGLPVNNLASWDGSLWRSVGTGGTAGGGGVNSPVYDLAAFDGALIVAGAFTQINGSAALGSALARYDGTNWSGYAVTHDSTSASVQSLATFAGINSSSLYVGGRFTEVAGVPAKNIARFTRPVATTGTWAPVGTGLNGQVDSLFVQGNITSVTNVYAFAWNSSTPGPFTPGIQRFSSGTWNLFSEDFVSSIGTYGGGLAAGVNGFSRRVGNDWLGLGPGLNGGIRETVEHQGELVAVGEFTASSTAVLNRVAKLTAAGWEQVGGGLPPTLGSPRSLVSFNGNLFVIAGSAVPGTSVLRYDGTSWATVMSGASGFGAGRLRVIGTELYLTTERVERWNGGSFVALGTGLPSGTDVSDVVMYNGSLHAVLPNNIYRLVGSVWTPAYTPRSGYQFGNAYVWNGQLFASCNRISNPGSIDRLVGSSFVASLQDHFAQAFMTWNGRPTIATNGSVRTFDGSSWIALETPVSAGHVAVVGGDLVVSSTSVNGAQVSPLFTRLSCCRADFNGSGVRDVADIFAFLSAWFASAPGSDFNGSGVRDVADIFAFLSAWFAGC